MHGKSQRRIGAVIVALLVILATATATSAKPTRKAADPPQLTVLTNAISIFGITPASLKSANTIGSWKFSVNGRTRTSTARSRGDIVAIAISDADMIDGFPVALRRRRARR